MMIVRIIYPALLIPRAETLALTRFMDPSVDVMGQSALYQTMNWYANVRLENMVTHCVAASPWQKVCHALKFRNSTHVANSV